MRSVEATPVALGGKELAGVFTGDNVRLHVAHIYAKLDVGSRVELAKALYQKV